MREAPSLVIVADLVKRGATVTAYDPIAVKEAKRAYGNQGGLSYADNAMDTLEGADALIIATEWREFRSPDFDAIKSRLRHAVALLLLGILHEQPPLRAFDENDRGEEGQQ